MTQPPLLALVLGAEKIRIKDTYIEIVVVRSRFIRYGIALLNEVSSVRKVALRSSITYVLSSNMLKYSLPSRVEQSANPAVGSGRPLLLRLSSKKIEETERSQGRGQPRHYFIQPQRQSMKFA